MSEKINPTPAPEVEENDLVTISFSKKSIKRKAILALAAVGGVGLCAVVLTHLPDPDEEEEADSAETPVEA